MGRIYILIFCCLDLDAVINFEIVVSKNTYLKI